MVPLWTQPLPLRLSWGPGCQALGPQNSQVKLSCRQLLSVTAKSKEPTAADPVGSSLCPKPPARTLHISLEESPPKTDCSPGDALGIGHWPHRVGLVLGGRETPEGS